jgi:uncharacterized protein involved in response to NO
MPAHETNKFNLFGYGFRPFFLGAGLFSLVSVSLWLALFLNLFTLPAGPISSFQWHAHEMIYGYAMAVIAGFLLTAVSNWTGLPTPKGVKLTLIFSLWALARLFFSLGEPYLLASAICDLLFNGILLVLLSRLIIQSKQHKQFAVVAKLLILFICNLLFFLGVYGYVEDGFLWGIYGGLYTVVGLILTIGRRVLPFFIERGVPEQVHVFNSKWLDLSSLFAVLIFFISELVFKTPGLSAYAALVIAAVNGVRLIGWHTPGIWKRSLLWSIYLSFWFICLGFLLIAASYFFDTPKHLAIHALAYGGIGLATLSMMSRVGLGHTGLDISKPSKAISVAFSLFIIGTVVRVLLPLLNVFDYLSLIKISQLLWIFAFIIFTVIYLPILCKPRADGKPG